MAPGGRERLRADVAPRPAYNAEISREPGYREADYRERRPGRGHLRCRRAGARRALLRGTLVIKAPMNSDRAPTSERSRLPCASSTAACLACCAASSRTLQHGVGAALRIVRQESAGVRRDELFDVGAIVGCHLARRGAGQQDPRNRSEGLVATLDGGRRICGPRWRVERSSPSCCCSAGCGRRGSAHGGAPPGDIEASITVPGIADVAPAVRLRAMPPARRRGSRRGVAEELRAVAG